MEYPNLYNAMNQIGQELVSELKNELIDKGKQASSKLVNSIGFNLVGTDKGWNIVITSEDYLKYVDQGRKPGKMPPSNKLIPWIQSKGISFGGNESIDQMAFVIAKSIGENGIPATNVIKNSIEVIYNKRKDLIAAAMVQDLQDLTIKIWNN